MGHEPDPEHVDFAPSNKGAHLRGLRVRSHYLGYDCYAYGPMGRDRKIRCLLRPRRMPPHLEGSVRDLMPLEVFWPTGVHEEAHRCIDAIYQLDVDTLRAWKKQWPDHNFGIDPFLDTAERWHAARRDEGAPVRAGGTAAAVPAHHVGGRRFPVWVKRSVPVRVVTVGGLDMCISVVYFTTGQPALRVDIYPTGDTDSVRRLTRVHADLKDGGYDLIEHFPGRYQAVGLSPLLACKLLGLRRSEVVKRTSIWDDPRVQESRRRAAESADEPTERERARATTRRARELYGQEAFGAHLLPAGLSR